MFSLTPATGDNFRIESLASVVKPSMDLFASLYLAIRAYTGDLGYSKNLTTSVVERPA